jgi:hypothetical protein
MPLLGLSETNHRLWRLNIVLTEYRPRKERIQKTARRQGMGGMPDIRWDQQHVSRPELVCVACHCKVAYLRPADIITRPLLYCLHRMNQLVISSPTGFTPRSQNT